MGLLWGVGDGYARSDADREQKIRSLGRLICAPGSSRVLRQICFAQQRQLIRGRSAVQVRRMEITFDDRLART